MARTVHCIVTHMKDAEGLDAPPFPGELGQRIYEQVSRAGWRQWLDHLAVLINENRLNTADVRTLNRIEAYMREFFFQEKATRSQAAEQSPTETRK